MINLGEINRLKVKIKDDYGYWLIDDEGNEVFLPKAEIPPKTKLSDELDVFIYKEAEDKYVATCYHPIACVGEFAMMRVVSVCKFGAFLDWGISKNVLVPLGEQSRPLEEGKSYIVCVYIDAKTDRVAASTKIEKYLSPVQPTYSVGQKVSLLIYKKTDLGYKAIINNSHEGILYQNEVFQILQPGQKIDGYIKKLREDGKIDLQLNHGGYENIESMSDLIVEKLLEYDCFIPITDKSEPETIYDYFSMSKKSFKKAIGMLYKKHLVLLEDDGIRLIKSEKIDENR